MRSMTSSVVAGPEVRALVDQLGEWLGRSVVVDDPAVRLVCASRHFGDEDSVRIRAMLDRDAGDEVGRFVLGQGAARWHGPHMLDGSDELGLKSRLCVPLYGPSMLIGLLMVIDADRTLTSAQIAHIDEVSRDIAAHMYADSVAADPRQIERRAALDDLLGDDESARRSALGYFDRDADFADADHVSVMVVAVEQLDEVQTPVDVALRVAVDTVTRSHSKSTRNSIGDDQALLLQIGRRPTSRSDLSARALHIKSELDRLLGGTAQRTRIGIGSATGGLPNAALARRRGDIAARAATRLGSIDNDVAFWDDLGIDALLLDLPDSTLVWSTVPKPLRDLIAADTTGKLVATLETFLDHGGSIARTAAALHMHRTSLYYRLDQIREATGVDLDSGADRLSMHVGLHLAKLIEKPS
jgi:DNA-binding PucR family transcriptional regulator